MDETLREPFPPMTGAEFDALAAAPAVAEMRFTCVVHATEAGLVRLLGGPGGWVAAVDSVVCAHRARLHREEAEELLDALREMDVRRVHALEPEWAPFYCPACERVYCGECWRTTPVFDAEWVDWIEEVRGVCPRGHERMLSD
jgi:hypothetical protein